MSIMSMTGFGRGQAGEAGRHITIEISAVNRKQFDLRVHAPRALQALESAIAKRVRAMISRGGLTLHVSIQAPAGLAPRQIVPDLACAEAYLKAARKLGKSCGVSGSLSTYELMRLPGVLPAVDGEAEDSTHWTSLLWPALDEALAGLTRMRATEGKALAQDARRRLLQMERLRLRIQRRAPRTVRRYRDLLAERLDPWLQADSERAVVLAREIAVFADRCDMGEELVRLASHIKQSLAHLEDSAPAGRSMEFLCQEMLREINTIGAKANDVEIAGHVVALKAQLECLREQVQNIE